MDKSVVVNIAAIVVSLCAVVVSSLFAVRQLRSMRRSDETLVAIELLTRECRTDEFLTAEDFVLRELAALPAGEGVNGLPVPARRHATRVGLYYSSLGFLAAFDGMREKMIVSLVPNRARRAWFALEPFITAERRLRSPTYLSYFEHLVCLIDAADLGAIHRELRLRKIGDRSAEIRAKFELTERTAAGRRTATAETSRAPAPRDPRSPEPADGHAAPPGPRP